MTPHIQGKKGEYAKTVLMPGDPLRAKYIAETYLEESRLVNETRGMLGYTGTYKGKPISVQGSGMGMPSIGIYSYELYHFYGVESIIRVGTIGGIAEQVKLRDIVIGMSASTNSNYAKQYAFPGNYAPTASYPLLETVVRLCREKQLSYHVGTILSSDTFYDDSNSLALWKKGNVLGVEMEAAALYMNAAREGKNSLCICTVSDCPLEGLTTTAEERQTGFSLMMELPLDAAVTIS